MVKDPLTSEKIFICNELLFLYHRTTLLLLLSNVEVAIKLAEIFVLYEIKVLEAKLYLKMLVPTKA